MLKRKRSPSPQVSHCEEGSSPTVKRYKPLNTERAQQRRILDQLTPAGGLDAFNARYEQSYELGAGVFGSVYCGVRKYDRLQVAIKHIPKDEVNFFPLASYAEPSSIPMEVYFMFKAAGGPERMGQSAAVSLLEWFLSDTEVIIVMERPYFSMDLRSYLALNDPLPEHTARDIIRQLVPAVTDLHKKGVFHGDLKTENILIQDTKDGIRVRIIDFGCSSTVTVTPYTSYSGTLSCCPPEMMSDRSYRDKPASVWQIGGIAYELLNGDANDFATFQYIMGEQTLETSEASEEGKDFVQLCLELRVSERIALEELESHPWLNSTTAAN